jgi:hypothetical protein
MHVMFGCGYPALQIRIKGTPLGVLPVQIDQLCLQAPLDGLARISSISASLSAGQDNEEGFTNLYPS